METTLDSLCPDLKLLLLKYLDVDELLNFSLVSKQWYHFISSDAVWLEKFRLLETKPPPEAEPPVIPRRSSPRRSIPPAKVNTPASNGPGTFLPIWKTLSPEQLKVVRSHKFFSIYKTKLAFFLNKTHMIFNRLLVRKEITSHPYNDFSYYGDDPIKENLEWGHWDENSMYVVKFKIYHLEDTTRYNFVFLLHYNLPNQWIEAGVKYTNFRSCGNFCLAKVANTNIIHVFRFSFATGKFEKTQEWELSDPVGLNSKNEIILTESTVSFCGQKFLCHYDLYSGKKLSQIQMSAVVKSGEDIAKIYNAGKSRVLFLVKYHTKKYVQEKVLLLNLANGEVLWTTKLNCIQAFMKLAVAGRYFVVLKNKKTLSFQLTFAVYDLATGAKQYDVPYHPAYFDYKDSYLSPGNILLVRCDSGDYYYDLGEQKRLHVTLDIKPPKAKPPHYSDDESDGESSSEQSDDDDEVDSMNSYYEKGPGDTVLLHVLHNEGHEMAIYLVDCRNNRHVLLAKLQGLKMGQHQLDWDKQYRHLIEYYDHHICGTSIYRLW